MNLELGIIRTIMRDKLNEYLKSAFSSAKSEGQSKCATRPFVEIVSPKLLCFINTKVPLGEGLTTFLNSRNISDVENLSPWHSVIANIQKVNNIRYNNKFYEAVNRKLIDGGYFVNCVETYSAFAARKRRYNKPILRYFYFTPVLIYRRIIPKIKGLRWIFYSVSKGRNRLVSKAETLGRLVSCGFEIVSTETIDGLLYVISRKISTPQYNLNPSYGPLFKMPRVGKDEQVINVYKFRTMHPYSEYLQDYIIKLNGYASTGKPANDFRVAGWAKFMRRYWIDELPQLINVLKGEMKLVGVRPVSKTYFEMLPEEVKNRRRKHKPGCIPPYVSLNRSGNVVDVLDAEMQYLEEYEKSPIFTDLKYFFKAITNIFFKGKRSA